jgi:NTE family protein
LRASIAIPGVLPPVFEGGEVLVDGGVINNLPADVMYRQSAGPLIGIDIAGEQALSSGVDGEALPNLINMTAQWFQGLRRPSMLRILIRAGMVNSKATNRANRQKLNLLLQPPVDDIDLLDWAAADRAIAAGYRHACGLLESAPDWFGGS